MNAHVDQFRHVLDGAQVFGVHDVGAVFVFVGRDEAAGAVGFFQQDLFGFEGFHRICGGGDQVAGLVVAMLDFFVVPAAGVGAGALVGVAVVHVAGQQAAAGVGHAQGAVYKHFQFHRRNLFADFADFFQAQFPGQDHAADALAVPEFHGGPVNGVGLHRQVNGLVRPFLSYQHDQAGVRHDQGVGFLFNDRLQVSQVAAHLVVVGGNVGNQVELFAQFVRSFNACAQGCNVFETVVPYS